MNSLSEYLTIETIQQTIVPPKYHVCLQQFEISLIGNTLEGDQDAAGTIWKTTSHLNESISYSKVKVTFINTCDEYYPYQFLIYYQSEFLFKYVLFILSSFCEETKPLLHYMRFCPNACKIAK